MNSEEFIIGADDYSLALLCSKSYQGENYCSTYNNPEEEVHVWSIYPVLVLSTVMWDLLVCRSLIEELEECSWSAILIYMLDL